MFNLEQKREVWWPVTIPVPQNGGAVSKARVEVLYEVLTQPEIDQHEGPLLERVVRDVKGMQRGEEKVEFNDETKADFLKHVYVRNALMQGYGEVQRGEGARKN